MSEQSARLATYVETLLRRRYAHRLDRFFSAQVATVTAASATTGRPYLVTLTRTGEAAPDGNEYLCATPGYIPRIGDLVDCMWRDETSAYVMWPTSAPGLPTFTNLAANLTSAVLTSGSDLGGLITFTAGASNVSSGRICTVNFSTAFPIVPRVHLTGQTTWQPGLNGAPTAASFDIYTSGLSANTSAFMDFSVGDY